MSEEREKPRLAAGLQGQTFKEVVTAILGLMLVAFTLYVAARTLAYAGDSAKVGDAKSVLIQMAALTGVVLGYYFGRVPAEARADQAQERADVATSKAQKVGLMSQDLVTTIEKAGAGSGEPDFSLEGIQTAGTDLVEDLRGKVAEIRRHLDTF